ncbi:MAG: DUF2267 domain-containing protein [Candidatus Limnocylindria bacterium]
MTTGHVTALDHSIEKANIWINEMAEELGTEDRQAAYRALRGFLHALRDRIPVNETAQLAAQLPELVRGVYYENWRPSTTPRSYHSPEQFLEAVADEALLVGPTEASYAVTAGAAVLRRHVSPGEIEDVVAVLPAGIGRLLS